MTAVTVAVETDGYTYWFYCLECDETGPEHENQKIAEYEAADHECQ